MLDDAEPLDPESFGQFLGLLDGMQFYRRSESGRLCLVAPVGSMTPDIRYGLERHLDDLLCHGDGLCGFRPNELVPHPVKPGEVVILF